MELIAQADKPVIIPAPGKRKFIAAADLTDVFGIEFDESANPGKSQDSR
jgi:hypothetical protein